jgi:hypothetical protein
LNIVGTLRSWDEVQAPPELRKKVKEGQEIEEGEVEDGADVDRNREPGPRVGPKPPRPHRPGVGRPQGAVLGIPCVCFTNDAGLLDDMRGRAALYRRADNTVFLNPKHWRYEDDLSRLYEEVGPDSELRQLARKYYEEAYKFHAGRLVVCAWLYKGRPDWTETDWQEAIDMQSLTVHLTLPDSLREAQNRIRQRLNSGRRRKGAKE